jgi:glycosyltransferase involved in cell wall biosynthesis
MLDTGAERLLVVAPALNEAAVIGRVVRDVREIAARADVLVVDDGSTDETARRAAAAGAYVVRHAYNLGIGAAVQTGLKFACARGYDLVVRVDGDGQHRHEDIPALYAALCEAGADAAFGSRFLPDGPWRHANPEGMAIPPLRRAGIVCFSCLIFALTGERATDPTSGFACYSRRATEVLAAFMPQDYPEVESRIILHRAGLRTVETPTRMLPRRTGASSITAARSLYYAGKVTVAVLMTALKSLEARSPYDREMRVMPPMRSTAGSRSWPSR